MRLARDLSQSHTQQIDSAPLGLSCFNHECHIVPALLAHNVKLLLLGTRKSVEKTHVRQPYNQLRLSIGFGGDEDTRPAPLVLKLTGLSYS